VQWNDLANRQHDIASNQSWTGDHPTFEFIGGFFFFFAC
jgi:hypothetical protein